MKKKVKKKPAKLSYRLLNSIEDVVCVRIDRLFAAWSMRKDQELATLINMFYEKETKRVDETIARFKSEFSEDYASLERGRKKHIALSERHALQVEQYLHGFNKLLEKKL